MEAYTHIGTVGVCISISHTLRTFPLVAGLGTEDSPDYSFSMAASGVFREYVRDTTFEGHLPPSARRSAVMLKDKKRCVRF